MNLHDYLNGSFLQAMQKLILKSTPYEHLLVCSVCDSAEYNWMKKNQNMPGVAQENGFGSV
jgi:hypothetical protein